MYPPSDKFSLICRKTSTQDSPPDLLYSTWSKAAVQAPPRRPAGLGSSNAVMLASAEVCLSWHPEIIRVEEGIWAATCSAKEDMVLLNV